MNPRELNKYILIVFEELHDSYYDTGYMELLKGYSESRYIIWLEKLTR